MLPDTAMSELFWARDRVHRGGDLNALVAAETLTGRDGITAHALPHDELVAVMSTYGRGPA